MKQTVRIMYMIAFPHTNNYQYVHTMLPALQAAMES